MAEPFDGKAYARSLSRSPGVYLMYDGQDKCMYVGKASSLRNRVYSYFSSKPLSAKVQAMVNRIVRVEVVTTGTEAEALLLESNLIKRRRPRYNIRLRDDKSYPYIYLDTTHDFPRLGFYRGSRKVAGKLYGPYPSARSVRETLALLQKVLPVRQCRDSFYENRSRPCLQYQIKRCPAPCVGLADAQEYAENVELVKLFLEGKSDELITQLTARIHRHADRLEYEEAARCRDRLLALQNVYQHQNMEGTRVDADVAALGRHRHEYCVALTSVRSGRLVGTRYFPVKNKLDQPDEELLAAFIAQYYSSRPVPGEIIVNLAPGNCELLEQAFSKPGRRGLRIRHSVRGDRARWLSHSHENALQYLRQKQHSTSRYEDLFRALKTGLSLEAAPERIECFDISHSQGESAMASCVVFESSGPVKSDYRRFTIRGITPGDDYAAMSQVLERRYSRVLDHQGRLPDMVLIDGGAGQLNIAVGVFSELAIDSIQVIGVAKGEARRPGLEKLVFPAPDARELHLEKTDPALHLVQSIRDEAHRFAITGHRQKRSRARFRSQLEKIPGIGDKRRKALLTYFGGIQGIRRAGIADLQKVEGISTNLARSVYEYFH